MLKRIIPWGVALVLSACSTPYGKMGLMGGVDATPLGPDREMILAKGNGFTDPSRVQQFVLLKASEDCLAAGYDKFFIMSAQDVSRQETVTTPGYANSYSTLNGSTFGGNFSGNMHTTTTVVPGQTLNFVKPGASVIVQFVRNGTAGTEQALDARYIQASLGPKLMGD